MLADDALRGRSLLQLRDDRYSLCRPLPKGTLKTSRDMLARLLFQGLGSGGKLMSQRVLQFLDLYQKYRLQDQQQFYIRRRERLGSMLNYYYRAAA